MIYLAWAIAVIGLCASGTYLVITEHGEWAWIPFLIAFLLEVKTNRG